MFLTPLLIHRKLPVTARTAGNCDRPEAPTATPAFILLYLSSPVSGTGSGRSSEQVPFTMAGTAAQTGSKPPGRARASTPPPSGAHSGALGQTAGQVLESQAAEKKLPFLCITYQFLICRRFDECHKKIPRQPSRAAWGSSCVPLYFPGVLTHDILSHTL